MLEQLGLAVPVLDQALPPSSEIPESTLSKNENVAAAQDSLQETAPRQDITRAAESAPVPNVPMSPHSKDLLKLKQLVSVWTSLGDQLSEDRNAELLHDLPVRNYLAQAKNAQDLVSKLKMVRNEYMESINYVLWKDRGCQWDAMYETED